MTTRTLAHLSDLHVGRADTTPRLPGLVDRLLRSRVDHVVVTGDVTDGGLASQWEAFERAFEPLLETGRVSVVPGNHDRLGDDVGPRIQRERVQVDVTEGAWIVRLDSTGLHNRRFLNSHGRIDPDTIDEVRTSLQAAPRGRWRVLALHHHLVPLPGECFWEHLSTSLGLPNAAEVRLGRRLLDAIAAHCDLVLHGHRHVPVVLEANDGRPTVVNAGSSTEQGRFRLFRHRDGALLSAPRWQAIDTATPGDGTIDGDRPPARLLAVA